MSLYTNPTTATEAHEFFRSFAALGSFGKEHIAIVKTKNTLTPTLSAKPKSFFSRFYKKQEHRLAYAFDHLVACITENEKLLTHAKYVKRNLEVLRHIEHYFSTKPQISIWKLTGIRAKISSMESSVDSDLVSKLTEEKNKQIETAVRQTKKEEERLTNIEKEKKQELEQLKKKNETLKANKEKLDLTVLYVNFQGAIFQALKNIPKKDAIFKMKNLTRTFHRSLAVKYIQKKEYIELLTNVSKDKVTIDLSAIKALEHSIKEPDLIALEKLVYLEKLSHLDAIRLLKMESFLNLTTIKYLLFQFESANLQDTVEMLKEATTYPHISKIISESNEIVAVNLLCHLCNRAYFFLDAWIHLSGDKQKVIYDRMILLWQDEKQKLFVTTSQLHQNIRCWASYNVAKYLNNPKANLYNPSEAVYRFLLANHVTINPKIETELNTMKFEDLIGLFPGMSPQVVSESFRKSFVAFCKDNKDQLHLFIRILYNKWPSNLKSYDIEHIIPSLRILTGFAGINLETHIGYYMLGMCKTFGLANPNYVEGISDLVLASQCDLHGWGNAVLKQELHEKALNALKSVSKKELNNYYCSIRRKEDDIGKILIDYLYDEKNKIIPSEFPFNETKNWLRFWVGYYDKTYAGRAQAILTANK